MAKQKTSLSGGQLGAIEPPPLPEDIYNRCNTPRLLSRGRAEEIWNWAWHRAGQDPQFNHEEVRVAAAQEFFFSNMEAPELQAAACIGWNAVVRRRRSDLVRALPNQAPRGGFTYGYQWSGVRPPEVLKFPMEFGDVTVYPLENSGNAKFLLEFTTEPDRWRRATLNELEEGGVDVGRVSVALDWHAENGISLNPFVTTEWMPPRMNVTFASNPAAWMNEALTEWAQRWDSIGEMWWLDERIVDVVQPDSQWKKIYDAHGRSYHRYEVRSLDVWGNARDGYEVNNTFRVGEVVVPEDGDVVQVLVDAGHLRADHEATNDIAVEDNYEFIEVLAPEEPVEMPERSEDEGDLPESFADEVWQYGWDQGLDPDFRSETGVDDTLQHFDVRNHWPYSTWRELVAGRRPKKEEERFVEEAMEDAYRIARAAYDEAVEATRNESRIPLFHLQLIEDE